MTAYFFFLLFLFHNLIPIFHTGAVVLAVWRCSFLYSLSLFLLIHSAPWRGWHRRSAPLRSAPPWVLHVGWGPSESTKHECFTAFWSQANLCCLPPVSSCLNKNESGVLLQAQRGLGGIRSAEQRCAGMCTARFTPQDSALICFYILQCEASASMCEWRWFSDSLTFHFVWVVNEWISL